MANALLLQCRRKTNARYGLNQKRCWNTTPIALYALSRADAAMCCRGGGCITRPTSPHYDYATMTVLHQCGEVLCIMCVSI